MFCLLCLHYTCTHKRNVVFDLSQQIYARCVERERSKYDTNFAFVYESVESIYHKCRTNKICATIIGKNLIKCRHEMCRNSFASFTEFKSSVACMRLYRCTKVRKWILVWIGNREREIYDRISHFIVDSDVIWGNEICSHTNQDPQRICFYRNWNTDTV